MTKKPYKGNYKGIIGIHRHSKVGYPKSKWVCGGDGYHVFSRGSVQDISKGLQDPIYCNGIYEGEELLATSVGFAPKHQKDDWSKDIEEQIMFMGVPDDVRDEINKDPDGYQPKPSLLTRVKERFKR